MATALMNSVMTLGPSPHKILTSSSSCISGQEPASPTVKSDLSEQRVIAGKSRGDMASAAVLLDTSSNQQSSSSSSASASTDLVRCKRRINFTHLQYAIPHAQPVAVARRNARERNRVKQVNNGFSTLRQHIPFTARNKKMSKVETLRCAVEYIRGLQQLLDENCDTSSIGVPAINGALSPAPSSPQSVHHEDLSSSNTLQQEELTGATSTVLTTATGDWGYYSNPSDTVVLLSDTTTYTGISQQTMNSSHLHHLQPASLSPPCSAPSEPASSPTPSFTSESEVSSYHTSSSLYEPINPYEKYEPMSPEDEVLLDAISLWQQQTPIRCLNHMYGRGYYLNRLLKQMCLNINLHLV